MKRILSLFMALILFLMLTFPSFAAMSSTGQGNVFSFPDGTSITYYLDEANNPYRIINGQKVYVALALEHLEVTDPILLAELNNKIASCTDLNQIQPLSSESVFDMSDCGPKEFSREYSVHANLSNTEFFETSTLIYNGHHTGLKINTDSHSPVWATNKISFIYYFYHEVYNRWYSLSFIGQNCSYGYTFQHSPSVYPKGYFKILAYDNLQSCTIRIKTGPYLPADGVPIH